MDLLQKMFEKMIGDEGVVRESMSDPIGSWDGILLSDLGTREQRVVSGNLEELSTVTGGRIHCLILPAKFTGMEREAYERRRPHR
jgi:diphthamide biosynthesis methyltransferase